MHGRVLTEKRAESISRELEMETAKASPFIDIPGTLPELGSEDRLLSLGWLLWRQHRLILRFALTVAVSVLLLAVFKSNTYRSTTRLMPPENKGASPLAAMASMAGRMPGDTGALAGELLGGLGMGMQNTGDLFVGILHSRTAQERVVDKYDLTTVYGYPWLHMKAEKDDARKELELNTEISQDRKSGIIAISVVDHDPRRAAALARGYVDQLDVLIASLSTSAAGRERRFLEQRLVEVKKDLDAAAHDLSEFSSQNSTFDPKDQGPAMVNATATLQGELIAAESQLKGLEAIYTPNNARVRSLRSRIEELKRQMGKVSGSSDTNAPPPASDAPLPFPSLRQLPLLGVKYLDLYRRVKIQETVYQVLTQQYEMAKVQEAKEIPTVRVLDAADVPLRKWGPHRVLLALVGGVLGLLLGCVWVIGAEEWRKRPVDDPYKALLSDVSETIRRTHAWRWSESAVHRLRDRIHKPGTDHR